MRRDDAAVAGFFEDLPVLLFVLAGVAAIVFSGVFSAAQRADGRLQEDLDAAASHMVEGLVAHLAELDLAGNGAPGEDQVRDIDLRSLAGQLAQGHACTISLVRVHPSHEVLARWSMMQESLPKATGYAARVMNAVGESGCFTMLEVRVLVWSP